MTNTIMLERLIKESGLKKKYIAKKLNLSTYGLSLKINNKSEFTTSEIIGICELLGIVRLSDKENIFFNHKVDL